MEDTFTGTTIDTSKWVSVTTVGNQTQNDELQFDNGGVGSGGGSGDGATAHLEGHTLEISGGSYYENGKAAVAIVNGAAAKIDGATIRDNGSVVTSAAISSSQSGGSPGCDMTISNSNFSISSGATAQQKGSSFFSCRGGSSLITTCDII